MLRTMLSRRRLLGYAALVLAGSRVQADDKNDKPTCPGPGRRRILNRCSSSPARAD